MRAKGRNSFRKRNKIYVNFFPGAKICFDFLRVSFLLIAYTIQDEIHTTWFVDWVTDNKLYC